MSGTSQASDRYVYQVHPSYKSQTAIRITRRATPHHQIEAPQIQQENPYVFKPKSYSKKRNFRESISPSHVIPPPTKKFKPNNLNLQTLNSQNYLDKKIILTQLHQPEASFFKESFREKKVQEEESFLGFPLNAGGDTKAKTNPLLSHKIEIVSTSNQKLLIQIHQGLLKANTNHSKQEQTLQGVVNPFNSALKQEFSGKIEFIRDYKSGYSPIELQNKSKKQAEKEENEQKKKERAAQSSSKTHFIKKKQSTLSLARTCGVSYIKPSQSHQNGPYQPLPPLVFQCSTSCNYTSDLKMKFGSQIDRLINVSQNIWFPAILSTQEHMRDILLGKPFGRVIWVQGLKNLWPLFNEGTFILVFFDKNFASSEEQVWNQFKTCYFKFGILAKRSTSGKKLFLKSIMPDSLDKSEITSVQSFQTIQQKTCKMQIQANQLNQGTNILYEPMKSQISVEKQEERMIEEKKMQESSSEERKQCKDVCEELMKELKNSRTVITMSIKFEMYVHEAEWKKSSYQGKNLLNAIILSFEESLQKKSLEIIRDRLEIAGKHRREQILKIALEKIKVGGDISGFPSISQCIQPQKESFCLATLQELNCYLQVRNHHLEGKDVALSTLLYRDKEGRENISVWEKSLKMPIYYISTRDSFAFDLVEKVTLLQREGRIYSKIQYFFEHDNVPDNFGQYRKLFPNLDTGVTAYHNFFTEEQLQFFEAQTLQTEMSAFKNKFLQMTVQPTIIGSRIKRTKFFFGYRYMWTRCQLAEPLSYVGAGVRRDVTPAPKWLQQVENPMVENGILEPDFINSMAINVYHDGSEGLAQHFDDAVRFRQPIYTLRLVSDGRLSFGSQFYGFCNGAFIVPLPRGCILVMNQNSYAANGVKHCVRPCDMSGKSVAIIMRQMHHQVVREAAKYDQLIDFPAWLSTLSEDPRAITFAQQKRREAEQMLSDQENKKDREKAPKSLIVGGY